MEDDRNEHTPDTPGFDFEKFRYDPDAFKQACEELKATKQQALADALVQLETAAWSRHWTALKVARSEIERLTGISITGPLRRDLEAMVGRRQQEEDGHGTARTVAE
jgi:hypothetical protein